jgi:tRNA(fMet)-specific endonuclease VapC
VDGQGAVVNYFLDTDICVEYLRHGTPSLAKKLLSRAPSDIKLPSVVVAELIYGAKKSLKREQTYSQLKTFLNPLEIVPFDERAAECYGDIRVSLELKGNIIGGSDMMIAAIVLSRDSILVTRNTKEFSRVKSLLIENWMN